MAEGTRVRALGRWGHEAMEPEGHGGEVEVGMHGPNLSLKLGPWTWESAPGRWGHEASRPEGHGERSGGRAQGRWGHEAMAPEDHEEQTERARGEWRKRTCPGALSPVNSA